MVILSIFYIMEFQNKENTRKKTIINIKYGNLKKKKYICIYI